MNLKTKNLLGKLFSLEGKRGIVTGASSGIGLGIAKVLADAGAEVYDFSRTLRPENQYEGIKQLEVDISDYEKVDKTIKEVAKSGGIDFLINNAGVTKRARAEEIDMELWEKIHKINVNSLFYICKASYPYLKQSENGGRIINIASMASYMGFSEVVPYCSSKSAVRGITRGLATEWVRDNILVNSISPGWFPSLMSQQVMDEERRSKILNKIPLGRFGEVEDIGSMALYLVSNSSKYITGQDFVVDGGAETFGF